MRKTLSLLVVLLLGAGGALFAGWEEGVAAFKAKNYQEAANQFQAFLDEAESVGGGMKKPEFQPAFFMLGQSLYKLNKFKEAAEPLKTALELKAGDLNTQLVLGQSYFKGKDYKNAAAVLSKIDTAALPDAHKAVVAKMLSTAYQQTGDTGMALRNWEEAAKLNPNDAATQFNYGTQALAAGYTDDAIAALTKAASIDSSDPAKQRALVNALVRKGRETRDASGKAAAYSKASSTAAKLVQLEDKYDNVLLQAETQLGAKQYDGAIASLGKASAKNSSDWLPLFYLGQAHTAKGTVDQAVKPLTDALGKPGADQKKIWSQLGFVYEKQKKYSDAIAAYNKAGDSRGVARVEENQRIAQENAGIEDHNARIEDLERQKKELEKEMQALPGTGTP
jgi:tetratricopeptide (TPR) repeat protein